MATAPKGLTDEMIEKIVKRDEELRRDYYDMPDSFPASSQDPNHNVTMVYTYRSSRLFYFLGRSFA